MDWSVFLKDNSQGLFTLSGVILGSLITFLGNYLNNKFQAKENEKERLERRRESQSQLRIELMKNDIKRIDDVINIMFEFINEVKSLKFKRNIGKLAEKDWRIEMHKLVVDSSTMTEISKLDTITEVLVYIHGEEVYKAFDEFQKIFAVHLDLLVKPSSSNEDIERAFEDLIASGGNFQKLLREKMISI